MLLSFVIHDQTTDSGYRQIKKVCASLEEALDTMALYSRVASGTFYLDDVQGTKKDKYIIMGTIL